MEEIPKTGILLLGESGVGKSALGNILLNKQAFKIGNSLSLETKEMEVVNGDNENENLTIIDTPGFEYPKTLNNSSILHLASFLKTYKNLKGIVIVINYQTHKISYPIRILFKILGNIFPLRHMLKNLSFTITHSFTKNGNLLDYQKEEYKGKLIGEYKKIIEEVIGIIPKNDPPCFFLDIQNEEEIQTDSKLEANKIVLWAKMLQCLDLSSAKDYSSNKYMDQQEEQEIVEREEIIQGHTFKITETRSRVGKITYDGEVYYTDWKIFDTKKEDLDKFNSIKNDENFDSKKYIKNIIDDGKNEISLQSQGLKKVLDLLIEEVKGLPEPNVGQCTNDPDFINSWKCGICTMGHPSNMVREETELDEHEYKYIQKGWKFAQRWEGVLQKRFKDRIIVGWNMRSDHDVPYGGYFSRDGQVLGTDHYKFNVYSERTRGCAWILRIWTIPKDFSILEKDLTTPK